MVDGVTSLLAMTYGFRATGGWTDERGSNLLDGGAPFYDTYALLRRPVRRRRRAGAAVLGGGRRASSG